MNARLLEMPNDHVARTCTPGHMKSGLRTAVVAIGVAILAARPPASFATEPPETPPVAAPPSSVASATPQRPSFSFNTATVWPRCLELEVGGSLTDSGSAVPAFLKYGLTERTEVELSFDAIRRVDLNGGTLTSQGDLVLGMRSRLAGLRGRRSFALAGRLKVPTARDNAGSGEFDARIVAIASIPAGRMSVDGNLWLSTLGQADGSKLGQVQGIATLNLPPSGGWSPFAEVAWQRTATQGSGGIVDVGLLYGASRTAVFDAAAGLGWSEGYPDWTVTAGWTILFNQGKPIARSADRRARLLSGRRPGG